MILRGKNVAGHADEARLQQFQPGFLEHFPAGGLQRRFAGLDPAARQLPLEAALRRPAPAEQDPPGMRHHHRYRAVDALLFAVDESVPATSPPI